ncbi:MAG TPA: hypothetical protein VLF39_02810 [Candidatus Saccharimonadales bacterium]|nr:hypothetical protein [Candidatus Saccharimonadales bacterium]
MKKIFWTIVVLVLMAGTGVGGYEIGTHKIKVTSNTSTNTQPTSTKTTTKPATTKQLDLAALLVSLQKQYPTVKQTYVYTQSKDPNGNLNKTGYYTAGAEFYDTRTNTPPDGAAFGADSGGAIEVYTTVEDAAKRVDYLKQFQGRPDLDAGAADQFENIVIRASSKYNTADQKQVLDYLIAQVKAQ